MPDMNPFASGSNQGMWGSNAGGGTDPQSDVQGYLKAGKITSPATGITEMVKALLAGNQGYMNDPANQRPAPISSGTQYTAPTQDLGTTTHPTPTNMPTGATPLNPTAPVPYAPPGAVMPSPISATPSWADTINPLATALSTQPPVSW